MQKGIKTRFIAYKILYSIKSKNSNLDEALNKYFLQNEFSISDKKMIHTIVLTSMRYDIHINKIIQKYIKKKQTLKHFVFFLSAVSQIVFLNFKEYAVVNTSVELAKDKQIKIHPGFVNAVLKKISIDKNKLKNTKINFNDLPKWFTEEVNFFSKIEKSKFLKTILEKPSLHIVFKKKISESFVKLDTINTSNQSLVFLENMPIENIPRYTDGEWWVQDYSAMLPIHLLKNIKNKKIIDMCSAPGGKAFQILSNGGYVDLIEINKNRAELLRLNMNRLKFLDKIIIKDVLEISNSIKYDFVILDSPCSSVGTIRRNPEIFFRKSIPNLIEILNKQEKFLEKASKIVKKNGIILYMVCSFLPKETTFQVEKFLKKNKNFSVEKFIIKENYADLIDKKGYINTFPKNNNKFNIDGFFAAKLIKND